MNEARGRRRLAAVMFTDIFGYTALMAEDEELGVQVRQRHRQLVRRLVESYGGDSIEAPGDETLSTFESALAAVSCALSVQEALREDSQLRVRIGVHSGDVVFADGEVRGDGVNLAARIRPLAEPGGVVVTQEVQQSIRNQQGIRTEPLGEQELKNMGRPVSVYAVSGVASSPALGGQPPRGDPRPRRLRSAIIAAATVLLIFALGLWASWPRPLAYALDRAGALGPPVEPPLPDRPSLVVLPFANMSADPGQGYFSDGITEELTAAFARNPSLFVISRSSAFSYKGRNVRLGDVSRELGVRYVIEGSVRRAEDRVRITVQLIDATTDFRLWNEQYDRDLADIFAVQSEIAESIQSALQVEILEAELERVRRKPTEDLTAYDALLRGLFELQQFTPDANMRARTLFERAIELDPGYAQAHAALGMNYFLEYSMVWSLETELIERAERYARRALELDPSLADGYRLLSQVEMFAGRHEEALAIAERAVELNPNDEWSGVFLAVAQFEVGSYLAAGQTLAATLRLNPRAPSAIWMFVGYVNAAVGRDEQAVELWERVRAEYPHLVLARIPLVIYYEGRGRPALARTVTQEILRTNPDLTAEQALVALPGHDIGLFGAADAAEDLENLRRAGLP